MSLLLLTAGTLTSTLAQPVVKLRNIEAAPGPGYTVYTDANGKLYYVLSANGAVTVNNTPVAYVPAASGNVSNNNEVVTDPNGDVWIIDSSGDAVQVSTVITGAETIITAGSNVTVTGDGTTGTPYIISSTASGTGGTDTLYVAQDSLVQGIVTSKVDRIGGTATTISTPGTGIYDFDIKVNSYLNALSIFGNNTTLNGSNEFVITVDNTANSKDRRFHVMVFDGNTGDQINVFSVGATPRQTVSSNVTTITIPGLGGLGPTGFFIELR